jgi:phenylalanyl-tRNA synthetase alpha chain
MSLIDIERQLNQLETEALNAFAEANSSNQIEDLRLSYLGQKGRLTSSLRGLVELDKSDRPKVGQLANSVKEKIQEALDRVKQTIEVRELKEKLSGDTVDVTLPGRGTLVGRLHPLTLITKEIVDIFYGMGFSILDGPEVESEYYNFDALNTPQSHPARDEQDTFYTDLTSKNDGSLGAENEGLLLRSQTSPVQIRAMEKLKPPMRVLSPGRVYRNEEVNARKYPLFHQVEGLLIDRNVTMGQLKGTLTEFIRLLFGKPLKTRFRPDFFPFTEPSAELDSECPFCVGKGCRTCGQRGWLELLGCGMVDPNVLSKAGIDPEEWNGFAFGMGVERLAMLKYNVQDIRNFYTNDMRFLRQF